MVMAAVVCIGILTTGDANAETLTFKCKIEGQAASTILTVELTNKTIDLGTRVSSGSK